MKHKSLTSRIMLALVLVLLLALVGTAAAQEPVDNGWVAEDGPTPQAIPITVDGGWHIWFWSGGGQPYNDGGALTFTSAKPVTVKVTDDFCKGDQFRIYDFGVLVGDTSAVAVGGCPEVGPDAAYADPLYSSGAFVLGPGAHSITIQVIVNPFNSGGAYIRVDANTSTVTDIPDPDAYTCSQPGYITFEEYADGFNLSAGAIGGVQFTTTGGYTWIVGDFAAGGYNGKYPDGGYTSQGTHWAWLGTVQGAGRIDFVNGPASYFSLLTSVNQSSVYLEAYDASDTLLDTAGPSSINFNTGHMDELAISRSIPDIAYVIVHDAGNYFDVDAICTDAPNQPPVADPNGPYLGAVGTNIAFDGTASFDPDGDPLTYAWTFGDAGVGTGATPSHSYTAVGIYNVCLTVSDGLATDTVCTVAVVYDPDDGFVTGGGWIDSPAGAYTTDSLLTGRATFGFISKYKRGASVPTGNTEFQFHAAGLNFHSSSYQWLVVTGSNYARFKGVGTINGEGEYLFMIWAGDDDPDTFRIKIWTEDEFDNETLVYDNGFDQELGSGSIIIHTKK